MRDVRFTFAFGKPITIVGACGDDAGVRAPAVKIAVTRGFTRALNQFKNEIVREIARGPSHAGGRTRAPVNTSGSTPTSAKAAGDIADI